MKLRIRGNSIRLRLTRGEVERVSTGESIDEITQLAGDAAFGYSLRGTDEPRLSAHMEDDRLVVSAPATALIAWATGDDVALDCPNAGQDSDILVEKDFACLSPRTGSDDEDTFPHPETGHSHC